MAILIIYISVIYQYWDNIKEFTSSIIEKIKKLKPDNSSDDLGPNTTEIQLINDKNQLELLNILKLQLLIN